MKHVPAESGRIITRPNRKQPPVLWSLMGSHSEHLHSWQGCVLRIFVKRNKRLQRVATGDCVLFTILNSGGNYWLDSTSKHALYFDSLGGDTTKSLHSALSAKYADFVQRSLSRKSSSKVSSAILVSP